MRLSTNLILFGLGLAGSTLAKSVCCTASCGVCLLEECGGRWGVCTSIIFNTCCADEKREKAMSFENEDDYHEAIAAGHIEG